MYFTACLAKHVSLFNLPVCVSVSNHIPIITVLFISLWYVYIEKMVRKMWTTLPSYTRSKQHLQQSVSRENVLSVLKVQCHRPQKSINHNWNPSIIKGIPTVICVEDIVSTFFDVNSTWLLHDLILATSNALRNWMASSRKSRWEAKNKWWWKSQRSTGREWEHLLK